MMTSKSSAALVLVLALAACAGGGTNIDITKPVTGEAASNAQRAYQRGVEEKKSSSFIEATRYFEWVRNNFPYSQYAALSELALADMAFDRDDFTSAATAYQEFVKSHPSHPRADYASFRVGLSYYTDKPSDWFLFPPAYERDQGPVKQSLDSLQRFTLSYPKSEFAPKARELIADCRERLAQHEQFVADFYWKRESWKGAAGRLMGMADTYGDLNGGKTKANALWGASVAWHNAHDNAAERAALQRLLVEAPNDPRKADAQARLKAIPEDAPKPAPEAKPAEAKPGEAPAPTSPAEQPGHPAERPAAAPAPGAPPDDPNPLAPGGPSRPAAPANQPVEPSKPVSQPPAAPVAPTGK